MQSVISFSIYVSYTPVMKINVVNNKFNPQHWKKVNGLRLPKRTGQLLSSKYPQIKKTQRSRS